VALALAESPDRLADYRRKLEDRRRSSPLFDICQFTKALEAAYQTMCDTWCPTDTRRDVSQFLGQTGNSRLPRRFCWDAAAQYRELAKPDNGTGELNDFLTRTGFMQILKVQPVIVGEDSEHLFDQLRTG